MADAPKRKRVLVSVPNGDAWIHKHVVFVLLRLLQDKRHDVEIMLPTHRPYVQNLHLVAHDFLAGGFDYLLSMDDDNPPKGNPLDLVELDLDIVGFPTPVWHCDKDAPPGDRPYYFNALRQVEDEHGEPGWKPLDSEEGFRPVGIQRADAVGTGCVLIARRVLATLFDRARELGPELGPMETPFMRGWNVRGEVTQGNDYAFCRRARAAGFDVWAHWDYTCMHFNELELTEMVEAMMRFRLSR